MEHPNYEAWMAGHDRLQVFQLLQQLREQHLQPTEITYTAAIKVTSRTWLNFSFLVKDYPDYLETIS